MAWHWIIIKKYQKEHKIMLFFGVFLYVFWYHIAWANFKIVRIYNNALTYVATYSLASFFLSLHNQQFSHFPLNRLHSSTSTIVYVKFNINYCVMKDSNNHKYIGFLLSFQLLPLCEGWLGKKDIQWIGRKVLGVCLVENY